MKESYFIGASEVKEIVGCSKSRAYQFIQQMNKELEAKGLLTFPGRVPGGMCSSGSVLRRFRMMRKAIIPLVATAAAQLLVIGSIAAAFASQPKETQLPIAMIPCAS